MGGASSPKALPTRIAESERGCEGEGANANHRAKSDVWDVLQYAAYNGRLTVVEALLEAGAEGLDDALLCGARGGHLPVVSLLLKLGANARYRGERHWTPLFCSTENGHLDVVRAVLDAGADFIDDALRSAVYKGFTAIVALLLDRGAQLHYAHDRALRDAAYWGHLETTTLLLDRGADPNAHPVREKTAVQEARDRGHLEVVALLLARGAIDEKA